MNRKQLIGILFVAAGAFLIAYSIHAMQKLQKARNLAEKIQDFFVNNPGWNPIITFFGGTPEEALAKYNTSILIGLWTGIGLVLLGFLAIFFLRKKIKKK